MKNATLDALKRVPAEDNQAAWAIARDATLLVPIVLTVPGDAASGKFLTIELRELQLVVAFTSETRSEPVQQPYDTLIELTGRKLASGVPADAAIVLDPGHSDGRVFLPDVHGASDEAPPR